MNKILILFAHPLFEKSRIQTALVNAIPDSPHITFHDLYELYPDFNIDVRFEQELLLHHDIIIWQHPFYWYSIPPLLKQWIDMVLQFGWAYGPMGDKVKDKKVFNVISSGGREEVYSPEGRNRYTVRQFLAPLEQTAWLCQMKYLPPFVIHGTHMLQMPEIKSYAEQYKRLLNMLVTGDYEISKTDHMKYLNELVV